MRNPIVEMYADSDDEVAMPWEIAVSMFRMHLASRMLRRDMSVLEITTKLNECKDTTLLTELINELFSEEENPPKCSLVIGDRQYDSTMSLKAVHDEGVIVVMTRGPRGPAFNPNAFTS